MTEVIEGIVESTSGSESNSCNGMLYNPGLEGVYLLQKVEKQHQSRLLNLDRKQQEISHTLTELKDHLKRCYRELKKPEVDGEVRTIDLSKYKDQIMQLWNEWKVELKNKDLDEYKSLSDVLNQLDFSKLSIEELDDKLIPELEKIQRFHEFKYQQIPNELRMFIELFTILVEILKEIPKKFAEVNSHISRNSTRG
ncbi:hypothetical protein COB11_02850 [Candidatus Aerophobetes bacterium]|uniref:Uncharacterized protein n=1 Tax=Aerophobetes bacterium TaxID=2030807 RepID=A0A2A4YL23_UNCAE|nr:MAG: hypothetical protein COB11_02850 [Candidatus Aerophobetes bacterium]